MRRAVVLLSGGLDSATVLALARRDGHECHALSFRYGQRHVVELAAAGRVAKALGASTHRTLDLPRFEGSALTGDGAVPKDRDQAATAVTIPVTYVPARNTVFLSHALALAEVIDARDIFIGANAVDYSGYPDCRPEFIAAFQAAAQLGTRLTDLKIRAPLVRMTKAEIILAGVGLGVDYSPTHSCYDPIETFACGRCDSCAIRRRGFIEADVADPTRYA